MPALLLPLQFEKISLYYEVFGPDLDQPNVQTMIFIHGGAGFVDGRLYYDFWGQFASDSLRIIFPEQRGSGRSTIPATTESLNLRQHAKDIHDLCELLNIRKPIIAGISQGGYVAFAYATQFPKDLSALMLCVTEAKRDTQARYDAFKISVHEYFGESKAKAAEIAEAIRYSDSNWNWESYSEKFGNYYSKKGEDFVGEFHRETCDKFMGGEWASFDFTSELDKITGPVFYLAGEYDCVHPPACAQLASDLMVNADVELNIVPDSAAPPYVDQRDISTQLVEDFLSKILK